MISTGGQVSIPADVRRRWRTRRILIDDRGSELVIRPVPDDPIRAAIGSLAGPGPSTEQMRASLREEDVEVEDRRWGTER
ncbi:MAG TPA: hypothetical protein VMP67_01710 [Candidatus Limnocylindria bacterium]|nr:hypothetical protein [Candidatus Limnocylindria bacterium]